MATVLASMARAPLELAHRQGVPRHVLLGAASLPADAVPPDAERVESELNARVWRAAERVLRDPLVGLRVMRSPAGEHVFGLVSFLAMTSDTVGDALSRVCRYRRVIRADTSLEIAIDDRGAEVRLGQATRPWPDSMIQMCIASYALLPRRWTGEDLAPAEVHLAIPRPRDADAYEESLGCAVRFGADSHRVVLTRDVLDAPLVRAHRPLCAHLEREAARSQARLPAADDVSARARDAIARSLRDGPPGLPRVAQRLGVTPRTLQRRLANDGVVYSELVDRVRRDRAQMLLTDASVSIADASEALGFSEPRSFRRAFARWTGMTPRAFRRACASR